MPTAKLIAGSGANDASYGAQAWETPNNITNESTDAIDDAKVTVGGSSSGVNSISRYIKALDFGFDGVDGVPVGSTIDGVQTHYEQMLDNTGGGAVNFARARLVVGGTIGTTDRVSGAEPALTGTRADYVFGEGATDHWGFTLTDTQVRAANFGAVMAIEWTGPSFTAAGINLRNVDISVHYTPPIPATAPEMAVSGNGVEIADGDTTPSEADHTDFGEAVENSGTVSRTFTITNSGDAELTLSGTPKVAVSGTHAAMFTVTTQPSSPVAISGGTTTFIVEFAPTSTGVKTATLSIANDDADANPYDFSIQGTGIEAPATTTTIFRKKRGQG